jgi:protein O-mannosyl-transferase
MDKKITIISMLLIAALGFIIYAPSLNGKFIYDDRFLVRDNSYTKNPMSLPKVFTQDIGSGADEKYSFYRPLQIITYMADYSLWGLNVFGYHLTNIILHILAAFTIYWLVYLLFSNALLSALVGLLFVCHPMHTEAVSYISGRSDPLSLIFLVLTFILYIRQTRKDDPSDYVLMVSSYILAILARENCMVLPLLLLAYHYAFKEKIKFKLFIPILAIALAYIILRLTALKFLIRDLPIHTTSLQRLPGFFAALAGYAKVLFWPFGLHIEYGAPVFGWKDPVVIYGILIFIALVALLLAKRRSKAVFFSTAWFFITILPVANIYPINAYMAEHWLYLPCTGIFILMASGIIWLARKDRSHLAAAIIVTAFILFFSFITLKQNDYWKDPISFYSRTVKYVTNNAKLYNNLGDAYTAAGMDAEAEPCFKNAIALDGAYAGAYNNLGNIYFRAARYEDAFKLYKKSVELKPDFALGYNNLGNISVVTGKLEDALRYYSKVIELAPNNPGVYSNIGLVNKLAGRRDEAVRQLKKAIEVNPDFGLAYALLSKIYFEDGDKALAARYYEKSVALGQKPEPAYEQELRK